jgi:hypothetical protein
MILSDRAHAWASFMTIKGFLLGAILVLGSVRALRDMGLIGPDGVRTGVRWSQHFTQTGMRIWRSEWATRRNRITWH